MTSMVPIVIVKTKREKIKYFEEIEFCCWPSGPEAGWDVTEGCFSAGMCWRWCTTEREKKCNLNLHFTQICTLGRSYKKFTKGHFITDG